MTEKAFDRAVSIKREIGWIEHAEYKDYPKEVDSDKAARLVIDGLYTFYKEDIDKFCTTLVSRYFTEREQRLERLRSEFESL